MTPRPHGLPDEHEPPPRPRADRCEQVAVATRRIRPDETCAASLVERAPGVLVEERLDPRSPRQDPLLQPEHDDDVEAACASTSQIEHGDPSGRTGGIAADAGAVECGEDVPTAYLEARADEQRELVERPRHRVVRPQV